ncbi:hypothetical protein ACVWW4_004258 [Bradyrhizobium sp. LB7.1]
MGDLSIPAIANPPRGVPRLVATDARFYSARNEAAARALGVCIPQSTEQKP